jgi:hypothetical protein
MVIGYGSCSLTLNGPESAGQATVWPRVKHGSWSVLSVADSEFMLVFLTILYQIDRISPALFGPEPYGEIGQYRPKIQKFCEGRIIS